MLFGAQVRQAGGLLAALRRAEAMGAEVMQVFAQSPRQWRFPEASPERAAELGLAWPDSPTVRAVVCHAPYLVNLGTPDDVLYERSWRCLTDNLRAVEAMGALGLVVHLGSHLGAGLDACLDRLADGIRRALDAAGGRLLLENTAGAGGTIGRSFEELARVLDRTGADPRVGMCLDTQHLWASGVSFATLTEADSVVADIDATVGLDRLACLHANDSKVGLGANRDRHENPGEGEIGDGGFRSLLGHPALQGLPAVLEVPGVDDKGPSRRELATLRRLHAEGLDLRSPRQPGRQVKRLQNTTRQRERR
jgi:deoxyribonuclease-4